MKRLHFLVEGPTEKSFVDEVLAGHLYQRGILCDARLLTTSRDWSEGRFYKGGITSYGKLRFEIESQIKVDHNVDSFFTTMVDYYGLPKDFPGYPAAGSVTAPRVAVQGIETQFGLDIASIFPSLNVAGHFIPNVMCHEFESLIFSDLNQLAFWYPNRISEISCLSSQLAQAGNDPELLNSSKQTAPSKRILAQIGEYDKVAAGALVAMSIGLTALRQRCLHFDAWISRLEAL